MKLIKTDSYILRTLLAMTLTTLFFGCQPPKRDNKPVAEVSPIKSISDVSEKTSTCESQIRQMMTSKSKSFDSIEELEAQVSLANAFLQKESNVEYSYSQNKSNTQSLKVEFSSATSDNKQSISYDLSLNKKDSADPMVLTLNYGVITVDAATELQQKFLISESCELRQTQTSLQTTQKKTDVDYSVTKSNYYATGESDTKTDDFSIPEGGKLGAFIIDSYNFAAIDNSYLFTQGIGLYQVQIMDESQEQKSKFGLSIDMKVVTAAFKNDSFRLDLEFGLDEKTGFKYSNVNGSETWVVTEPIWKEQSLGNSQELSQAVAVSLSEGYFTENASIELSGKKLPTYENFGAYWTRSEETAVDGGRKSVVLTEKEVPTISGTTTPLDLVSNETIQTELPEIQKAAKSILASAPKDREQQAQLILKYLSENYEYDYSMVNNNVVRPLTTEEALSRGKGVCQHYAVIFTAIARAMNIPTRIVLGFHLSDKAAGGHAWNEIEIRKGVWQVVEPQSKSLEDIKTRYYLPLTRGTFLENKKATQSDWIMQYLNVDYKISQPVSF